MKTIKINLYKFNELNKDAQQKAIYNYNLLSINNSDWYYFIYYDAKNIGLKINNFALDNNRHATGSFIFSANEVAQNIINEHGDKTETYKTAKKFMNDWQPIFNDYMNSESDNYQSTESEYQLLDFEQDFLSDILEDYSLILQKESEYLQSDEAIIAEIDANSYDFLVNGTIF